LIGNFIDLNILSSGSLRLAEDYLTQAQTLILRDGDYFLGAKDMSNYAKYFFKKFLWYLLTLILAISLNFFLPRLIPGNPVSSIVSSITSGMSDTNTIKEVYLNYSKELGLDQSLHIQYFWYLQKLLSGDLGTSFSLYPRKVSSILQNAIPWTLALQFPAILVGWILGNLLGAVAAYRKGIFDKVIFPTALFIYSLPFFTVSIMFLYVFAITLGWFPSYGGYAANLFPGFNFEFIGSVIRHHTLPFLSIVIAMIGGQAIGMREMSIYELNADYVLYSKLLGISNSKIVRYVFRNAMLPQVTGLALSLGTMISGSLICEIVFNYPGIGTTLFSAIRSLDYPMISGCTLLIAITVLLANFTIEILYGVIDPRVKALQMEDN
jgi:peptide/nickel transport system permease protein